MQSGKQQGLGIMLALGGVLVLSPDALLIRLVEADRATLLFWRTLLQGTTLMLALLVIYRLQLPQRILALGRWGIVATFVFAITAICFVLSLTLTAVANTLFMLATAPLFAALISWLFLGERIRLRTWIAIAFALVGIAIIFWGGLGDGTLIGDLLGLATAISLAVQFSIIRHVRHVNLVPALALGMLLVALASGLTWAEPLSVTRADFLWLFLIGVVVVPAAFALLTLAPRYISSPEVTLIMQLEAILGPLWVWMVLSEVPPVATFIGGSVVLLTLVIHSLLGIRAHYRRGRSPGGPECPVPPPGHQTPR